MKFRKHTQKMHNNVQNAFLFIICDTSETKQAIRDLFVGHIAWAPKGRSQAGTKDRQLEVRARSAPRLLVF